MTETTTASGRKIKEKLVQITTNGTSKFLVAMAMVGQEYHRLANQRVKVEELVEAINAFISILHTGKHDFGQRTQAVRNLHRRTMNICNDSHSHVDNRLKQLQRAATELAGVIRNHNRDNPSKPISQRVIDGLLKT